MSDKSAVRHVAIIMDGNGRWAQARGQVRTEGHKAGAETLWKIAQAASARQIEYMTVYAFSTENWKRPLTEVQALMKLASSLSDKEEKTLMESNIRLKTIGRTEDLPFPVRNNLQRLIRNTAGNTGMTLCLALSYGGRAEIVDAVNRILAERNGKTKVTEEEFRNYLYDSEIPDPDLLIRTGGEQRLSNFLLWQLSYAELYVTDTLWPDFSADDLDAALEAFAGRKRRFGKI